MKIKDIIEELNRFDKEKELNIMQEQLDKTGHDKFKLIDFTLQKGNIPTLWIQKIN